MTNASDPEDPEVFAYGLGYARYTGPLTVKKSEFESHKKHWKEELFKRNIQGAISAIRFNLNELEKYFGPEAQADDSGWSDSVTSHPTSIPTEPHQQVSQE